MRSAELQTFDQEFAEEARHVAWAPQTNWLAFGGSDGKVHFVHDLSRGRRARHEVGLGHVNGITCLAWSRDGEVLATGTDGGTIGLWPRSSVDNQLRDGLMAPGRPRAHDDIVQSLAWCHHTNRLASSSKDGRLRIWSPVQGQLLETADLDEPVLSTSFVLQGQLLVVQTLHRLVFLRCDPLVEVASFAQPSLLRPAQTAFAAHPESSRLATVSTEDHSISVWRVDFAGLLAEPAGSRSGRRSARQATGQEPGRGAGCRPGRPGSLTPLHISWSMVRIASGSMKESALSGWAAARRPRSPPPDGFGAAAAGRWRTA